MLLSLFDAHEFFPLDIESCACLNIRLCLASHFDRALGQMFRSSTDKTTSPNPVLVTQRLKNPITHASKIFQHNSFLPFLLHLLSPSFVVEERNIIDVDRCEAGYS